jgi:Protein of unknown function (DUF2892)
MCDDRIIRRIAGVFIMLSVTLGFLLHPAWFGFTAFVGFNLFQSSITSFCPLERVLGRFGVLGCTARQ